MRVCDGVDEKGGGDFIESWLVLKELYGKSLKSIGKARGREKLAKSFMLSLSLHEARELACAIVRLRCTIYKEGQMEEADDAS